MQESKLKLTRPYLQSDNIPAPEGMTDKCQFLWVIALGFYYANKDHPENKLLTV
jgi:hypothetical protein